MKKILYFTFIILSAIACRQNGEAETAPEETNTEKPSARTASSSVDSINALIREEGESARLFLVRARHYLDRQRLDAARNDLNQAAARDSSLAELHELRGQLHFFENQSREARDKWRKCIEIDPENINCLKGLTQLMVAIHDYERALELVDQQIEIDKYDPEPYFMKGIIIRDEHTDTALALQYFEKAIELKQDYFKAIDMMAVTLTQQKDTLAKFYFDRLLQMQPDNPRTYYKKGVYHMEMGEVNRALEAYSKAVQLDPGDSDSYYNLGYINLQLDQPREAREYFTKAIQAKERNYQAYYGRAYTFEVVGDLMNARKDYRKALDILPMYTPAKEALARVNRALNQAQ